MYYRVYYPTCVERKFGNISKKIATKCLIPSSRNKKLHFNSKLRRNQTLIETNQIPTINVHLTTVSRSDSVKNSVGVKEKSHSLIDFIKRNGKLKCGKYCHCCCNYKTVHTLTEHSSKCSCCRCFQNHIHNKPLNTYCNQRQYKSFINSGKHHTMQHREHTGEYSRIDSKQLLPNNRNNLSDKPNEYKYDICGKHIQGHINFRVAGINNLKNNIENHKCIHSYNMDQVCSQVSDDDSMNFLFYETDSETPSRYCINNDINEQRSNYEIKQNSGGNVYYQESNGEHDITELRLNYKNEAIKFDSISSSCKSVRSKFECEKSYLEISNNNRKREKPVANYLHNLKKSKRKISTKIFGKLKKFTDNKQHLTERSAPEERHSTDNQSSSLERNKFEQLGFNYIADGSETNILRTNLKLLQEKFRSPNTVLQIQKGCGSKIKQHRSSCYYFDATEPYQIVQNESTELIEELQAKETNRIKKNSLFSDENRFSSNEFGSLIYKDKEHLKIRRQSINKINVARDIYSNLQDISRILKMVHMQHRTHCNVKSQIIRKKCIPHKRKFKAIHRNITKNGSKKIDANNLNKLEEDYLQGNKLLHYEMNEADSAEVGLQTSTIYMVKINSSSAQEESDDIYYVKQIGESDITHQKDTNQRLLMNLNSEDQICSTCRSINNDFKEGSYDSLKLTKKPKEKKSCACNGLENGKNYLPSDFRVANGSIEAYWTCYCGASNSNIIDTKVESKKQGRSFVDTARESSSFNKNRTCCCYKSQDSVKTVESKQACCYYNDDNSVKEIEPFQRNQGGSCGNDNSVKKGKNIKKKQTCCCDDDDNSVKKIKNVQREQTCCCHGDDNSVKEIEIFQPKDACSCGNEHYIKKSKNIKKKQKCCCDDDENFEKEVEIFQSKEACSCGDKHSVKKGKNIKKKQICCCDDDENFEKEVDIFQPKEASSYDDNSLISVRETKTVDPSAKKPEQICFCSDSLHKENISKERCCCYDTPPKRSKRKTVKRKSKPLKTSHKLTQHYTVKIIRQDKPTQTCYCFSMRKDVPVQTSKTVLRDKKQLSKKVQTCQSDYNVDEKHKRKCASEEKCCGSITSKVEPVQTNKKELGCTTTASTSSYDSLVKSLGEECNKNESGSTTILSDYECDPAARTPVLTSSYDSFVVNRQVGERPCQCKSRQLINACEFKKMGTLRRDSCSMSMNKTRGNCNCYSKEKSTQKDQNYSREKCKCCERSERETGGNQINFKPTKVPKTSHCCAKDKPTECCSCGSQYKNSLSKKQCSSSECRIGEVGSRSNRNTTCTCTALSPDPTVSDCRRSCSFLPPRSNMRKGKRAVCLFTTVFSEGDDTCGHKCSSLENDDFLSSEPIKSQKSTPTIETRKDKNSQNNNNILKEHSLKETASIHNKEENVINQTDFQNSVVRQKELNSFKDFILPAEARRTIIDLNKIKEGKVSVQETALKNQYRSEANFISSASDLINLAEKKMLAQVSVRENEIDSSECITSDSTKSGSSTGERGSVKMENYKTEEQKYSPQGNFLFFDSKKLKDFQEPEKFETRKTKIAAESLIEKTEQNEEKDAKCSYAETRRHIQSLIPAKTKSSSRAEYIIFEVPNYNCTVKDKMKNMGGAIRLSSKKEDEGPKGNTLNIFNQKDDTSKNDYASFEVAQPSTFGKVKFIPASSEKKDNSPSKKTLKFEKKYESKTKLTFSEDVNNDICNQIKMKNMGAPVLESFSSEIEDDGSKKEIINTELDENIKQLFIVPTESMDNEDYPQENFISSSANIQNSFTKKPEVPEIDTSNENLAEISGIKDKDNHFKVTIKVKHKFIPKNISKSEEFIKATSPVHTEPIGNHEEEGMNTTKYNVTLQPDSSEDQSVRRKELKKCASLSLLPDLLIKETIELNDLGKEDFVISKLPAYKKKSLILNEPGKDERQKACWRGNSLDNFNFPICDKKSPFSTSSEAERINSNNNLNKNDECFIFDSVNCIEDNGNLERSMRTIPLQEMKCNGGNYNNSVVIINNYFCKSEQSIKYSYDIVTNPASAVKHKEEKNEHRKNQNIEQTGEFREVNIINSTQPSQIRSETNNQAIKRK